MKIEAVLFDFDMTLIDTSPALLSNINKICGHFGLPLCTREKLMDVIGYNSRDFWIAVLGGENPEYMKYYAEHCRPTEAEKMIPATGAFECLKDLRARGVRVGCASNRIGPLRVVREKGLEPFMDCVVGAETVKNPKPAPDVLLRGAELLNARCENTIYLGDTPIDVQAARNAGMRGVTVLSSTPEEALVSAGAWRVIPDLRSLVPLLEAENLI